MRTFDASKFFELKRRDEEISKFGTRITNGLVYVTWFGRPAVRTKNPVFEARNYLRFTFLLIKILPRHHHHHLALTKSSDSRPLTQHCTDQDR